MTANLMPVLAGRGPATVATMSAAAVSRRELPVRGNIGGLAGRAG